MISALITRGIILARQPDIRHSGLCTHVRPHLCPLRLTSTNHKHFQTFQQHNTHTTTTHTLSAHTATPVANADTLTCLRHITSRFIHIGKTEHHVLSAPKPFLVIFVPQTGFMQANFPRGFERMNLQRICTLSRTLGI